MVTNIATDNGRKPWVAVVLSLLVTGLGQVYCGEIARGATLLLLSLVFLPIVLGCVLLGTSTTVLIVLLLSLAASTGICVFAIVDAWLLARKQQKSYELKDYNRPVVYVAFLVLTIFAGPSALALHVRAHFIEAFYCSARSMEPNLLAGDRFLVNKSAYRTAQPQRGDIIVFLNPEDGKTNCVRRLIGQPGDRVAVRGNQVFINGEALPREPVPEGSLSDRYEDAGGRAFRETNHGHSYLILVDEEKAGKQPDFPETKVPSGHGFVLGDNRDRSRDSRAFGFVPLGYIKGRADYLYFPAGSWQRFGTFLE